MKFTPGPYNANIGPGGPDINKVKFPRVQAYMKAKMSPFMAADQAGVTPQSGTLPMAQPTMMPAPMASNAIENNPQRLISGSDIAGNRSGSFKR
jgi:hypothetical protein